MSSFQIVGLLLVSICINALALLGWLYFGRKRPGRYDRQQGRRA